MLFVLIDFLWKSWKKNEMTLLPNQYHMGACPLPLPYTNTVSYNLISKVYLKYCGIHSQHDLRSTRWTRIFIFFCYFGLGVGTSLLLVHWVRYKYHHISQKLILSSKILECQKIDLLLLCTRGLTLGFLFCRGMNFLLIHIYKFVTCCRLLLYIHNLSFSRIFTVCI